MDFFDFYAFIGLCERPSLESSSYMWNIILEHFAESFYSFVYFLNKVPTL